MFLKENNLKVKSWMYFLALIVLSPQWFSQDYNCSNSFQCCNSINFNYNYSVSYNGSGTQASIQFTPVVNIFPESNVCSRFLDGATVGQFTTDFGDKTSFGNYPSGTSSITHNYVLNNTCATNVFTVQTCVTILVNGVNYTCNKQQVISIQNPNVNSSYAITSNSLTCKTFSLNYGPASGSSAAMPIANAQWAFGDGTYGSIITNGSTSVNHSYAAAGTYVVTLTGDGISPCFVTTTVQVNDFVTPDFSVLPVNVCNAASGITLAIMSYSNSFTYSWTINGHAVPFSGNASDVYNSYLINGINTIKLTISNSAGCVTDVTKFVSLGSPDATFNVSSGTSTLCSGDMLSVSGLSVGADLYTWTITKPDHSTTTLLGMNPLYVFNPSNLVTLAGTYTIQLQTTTNYYNESDPLNPVVCTSALQIQYVTVNSIPNSVFSVSASSCLGTVSLNMPNTGFGTYTISYGDGTAGNGLANFDPADLTHNYTQNGIYTVSLTLNNNGCISTYDKNVSISSYPNLNITASETNICQGSTAILTANLSNIPAGSSGIIYSWTGPAGFASNSSQVTVSDPGTYQVTVTSGGSCHLNSSVSQVINQSTAPNVFAQNTTLANCTNGKASTEIVIPQSLQVTGYCINGNCTPANPSASGPIGVVFNDLQVGHNYITVSSASNQNCSTVLYIEVQQDNPVIHLNLTQPTSCSGGGSTGSANASPVPGSSVVKWYHLNAYPLNSFTTGQNSGSLSPDNYVVEAINGICKTQSYFTISAPVINVAAVNNVLATCENHSITVTLNSAFSPIPASSPSFNYLWELVPATGSNQLIDNGSNNSQSLGVGNYSVTVSTNGCSANYNFEIIKYPDIQASFESNSPNCKFQGQVEVSASGGDGNYSYSWTLNGTPSSSTTPILYLGSPGVSTPTTAVVTINDQSGCSYTSTPITITPASPVVLATCTPTGTGTYSATTITSCDIGACVSGGTAPYNFEWYKVGTGNKTVEWTFTVTPGGSFMASNGGGYTVSVPVPTYSTDITPGVNSDGNINTVYYPYWSFASAPPVPITSGASPGVYHTVVETVTITAQETFIASVSGPSGSTTSNADFTDGEYNLHVTDANGCTYVLSLGDLDFPEVLDIPFAFDYVWGMNPVVTPTVITEDQQEDVVFNENMIEAAAALLDAAGSCAAQQTKDLKAALNSCTDISNFKDYFNISYELKEHHYTLYYYDRAGQLTKTIPPQGVDLLSQSDINTIKLSRHNSSGSWPNAPLHKMPTTYHYNSFGQLLTQSTPDGGATAFIYDSKNRLRFSQNERQKNAATQLYSYTKYDELGRIIEVGESSLSGLDFINLSSPSNETIADNVIFPNTNNKQITTTVYTDQSSLTYYGKPQQFTQNRVSFTTIDPDPAVSGDEQYTYYSYDSHGNVEWLIQDDPSGIGRNFLRYEYDLVSGKVLKVAYNEYRQDRFFHKYQYDAENRLTKTFTSRDGELWDEDADYQYYAHGPLKRNKIGEDHVQGVDYIYTIQGWLKSINTPHLNPNDDPGQDKGSVTASGDVTGVALDRNGMILNYFDGDYLTSNTDNYLTASANFGYSSLQGSYSTDAPGLFNGNIRSWSQSQLNATADPMEARADLYQYDVLNRIRQAKSIQQTGSNANTWSALGTAGQAYQSQYTYDANGNLLTLKRFDDGGAAMDDLEYQYDGAFASVALNKNQLNSVKDNITANVTDLLYKEDLFSTHTYSYDPIGNLVFEGANEFRSVNGGAKATYSVNTYIDWTVYGKIKEVNKTILVPGGNLKERITFAYDASGNRTMKKVWRDSQSSPDGFENDEEVTITYYTRDAQGNVMATYQRSYNSTAPVNERYKYELLEQPIYGSDRIGQNVKRVVLTSGASVASLPIPSTGINTLSEYQNWITTANKVSLLPAGTDELCNCKVKSMSSNSATNPNYNDVVDKVEFLGIANNGVAVAEDINGQLQFYVVLAKQYLGNADACLVFDKDGNLMKGTENIAKPNIESKPIVVNITGTNTYAVVMLDANKQPIYSLVDMNATGYNPVTTSGEVISVNQPLAAVTPSNSSQGYHFTAAEDHINGKTIVYGTRYTIDATNPNKGNTEILAYDFGNDASVIPQEYLLYSIPGCGNTEIGELQISPEGDKLGWYQHDKSISGFAHRLGSLYTLTLTPNHLSVINGVDIIPLSQAGNYGNGMLDFMDNNASILYAQRGLYKEGSSTNKYDRNVWKYDPIASTSININPSLVTNPLVSYLFGEIRRGRDGNYYIPNMGEPTDQIHSYTGNAWNPDFSAVDATYELASALPTQVYKVFMNPTLALPQYKRYIGQKEYELKDHLGNVKLVISDEKQIVDNGTTNQFDVNDVLVPKVLNYSDYYPFGSPMPGRKYQVGEDYRYGMNGQESDDEVFQGAMTAEFWEYDARTGRRWNLDPIRQVSISDYACFRNSPIALADPKGDYSKIGAAIRNFFNGGGGIYKVGKEWGYNTLSKDENGKVDGIVAHFGVSRKELANSVREAKREALEEWVQEEKDIESFRRQGLWDDNITQEQGAKNAVNLGLLLIVNSPLTKSVAVEEEGLLLLETQGDRLKRIVQNPRLKELVNYLWRPTGTAIRGSGSTGCMIRYEQAEGIISAASQTSPHLTKGMEGLNTCKNLLKSGVLSESDRKIVWEIIKDLTEGTGLKWP